MPILQVYLIYFSTGKNYEYTFYVQSEIYFQMVNFLGFREVMLLVWHFMAYVTKITKEKKVKIISTKNKNLLKNQAINIAKRQFLICFKRMEIKLVWLKQLRFILITHLILTLSPHDFRQNKNTHTYDVRHLIINLPNDITNDDNSY